MNRSISIRPLQIFMLAAALMFLVFALGSLYVNITSGGIWGATVVFVFFFCYAVALLLTRGPIEIDDTGIEMRTPLGRYRMQWDEVRGIVVGTSDLWIIGIDKHLALVAPNFWTGQDKANAVRILEEHARHVGGKKPIFMLPWSNNCKVS